MKMPGSLPAFSFLCLHETVHFIRDSFSRARPPASLDHSVKSDKKNKPLFKSSCFVKWQLPDKTKS